MCRGGLANGVGLTARLGGAGSTPLHARPSKGKAPHVTRCNSIAFPCNKEITASKRLEIGIVRAGLQGDRARLPRQASSVTMPANLSPDVMSTVNQGDCHMYLTRCVQHVFIVPKVTLCALTFLARNLYRSWASTGRPQLTNREPLHRTSVFIFLNVTIDTMLNKCECTLLPTKPTQLLPMQFVPQIQLNRNKSSRKAMHATYKLCLSFGAS